MAYGIQDSTVKALRRAAVDSYRDREPQIRPRGLRRPDSAHRGSRVPSELTTRQTAPPIRHGNHPCLPRCARQATAAETPATPCRRGDTSPGPMPGWSRPRPGRGSPLPTARTLPTKAEVPRDGPISCHPDRDPEQLSRSRHPTTPSWCHFHATRHGEVTRTLHRADRRYPDLTRVCNARWRRRIEPS